MDIGGRRLGVGTIAPAHALDVVQYTTNNGALMARSVVYADVVGGKTNLTVVAEAYDKVTIKWGTNDVVLWRGPAL